MKTKLSLLLLLCATVFCLTSCQINWFNEHYDVPWYLIALPVILIIVNAHVFIISKTYRCPKCRTVFKPKWYSFSAWIHLGKYRLLKCPECNKTDFCDRNK